MAVDEFDETIGQMIELFKEYKPGVITIDNITKLCHTLGLESFIDDVDATTLRLSTASKIIVIDIDFNKSDGKVKDVKLVLASNFDNFNYFNDDKDRSSTSTTKNILLNSLTLYQDLQVFHHNLQYLYLLDTFSQIDVDTGASASNDVGTGYSETSLSNNNGSINAAITTGKLDLFKYFTELSHYLKQYFNDNSIDSEIKTNLNDKFGIYIISKDDAEVPIAKLYFEKSNDPQHRLYEYIYSTETKSWINESSESFTCGINLIMELITKNPTDEYNSNIWFPQDFISTELIIQKNNTNVNDSSRSSIPIHNGLKPIILLESLAYNFTNSPYQYDQKIQFMNDFTTNLIPITRFNINNDNLELISEIFNWISWMTKILLTTFQLITKIQELGEDNGNEFFTRGTVRHPSVTALRHRRSSHKNKRPSVTESTMFKDERFQQFNLHEIMAEPVIIEEQDSDVVMEVDENDGPTDININNNNNILENSGDQNDQTNTTSNTAIGIDNLGINLNQEMDIDKPEETNIKKGENTISNTGKDNVTEFIMSEDHVSLGKLYTCSFYDDIKEWDLFVEKLKTFLQ
ncbi:Med1p NDAI_0A05110 [Naumovozyma dairenensis CBS 421]|uniref:Mediator of RNA polymerase II transcription subunit 1 n=1 Tax=Naumovozyma dairenensis (strain ATCC 10597 / BCRC 20456 / CBS 421 / NBRC 0211 / NRRL Y-12639) TaxID=1071378 RepID=G0W4C8_NAUDC|nr:hypothetical protein NDAI_0A05110 [Naumovozyma dairenensis CBS 421]CCD22666.1 hypothetical protein NDAI_0A05110 [Naumovozyma dairenensis CBS 421]